MVLATPTGQVSNSNGIQMSKQLTIMNPLVDASLVKVHAKLAEQMQVLAQLSPATTAKQSDVQG